MVRLQLSSRSAICQPVLRELLAADSYEERTEGRDIHIAAYSLILNQSMGMRSLVSVVETAAAGRTWAAVIAPSPRKADDGSPDVKSSGAHRLCS